MYNPRRKKRKPHIKKRSYEGVMFQRVNEIGSMVNGISKYLQHKEKQMQTMVQQRKAMQEANALKKQMAQQGQGGVELFKGG